MLADERHRAMLGIPRSVACSYSNSQDNRTVRYVGIQFRFIRFWLVDLCCSPLGVMQPKVT